MRRQGFLFSSRPPKNNYCGSATASSSSMLLRNTSASLAPSLSSSASILFSTTSPSTNYTSNRTHQHEEEIEDLKRKSQKLQNLFSAAFSTTSVFFVSCFLRPSVWTWWRMATKKKNTNSKNNYHFDENYPVHQEKKAVKNSCGFLSCQFIRSATVMQCCVLFHHRDDDNKSTTNKNFHTEINTKKRGPTFFASKVTTKAAKQISKMMARIEGWGNYESSNHKNDNENSELRFLDSFLSSHKSSSEFMKKRGKPRVRVGTVMEVAQSTSRKHQQRRNPSEEININNNNNHVSSFLTLRSSASENFSRNHHHHQQKHQQRSDNPTTISNINNNNHNHNAVADNCCQFESKRTLFRPTTGVSSQICSATTSNYYENNFNNNNAVANNHTSLSSRFHPLSSKYQRSIVNVVLHPPEMSPMLAAHVDTKTRDLEKLFRLAEKRHHGNYSELCEHQRKFDERQDKTKTSQNNNNKNNNNLSLLSKLRSDPHSRRMLDDSERQLNATWTNAMRTWIGDTARLATHLRNYDDSLTGFRSQYLMEKLSSSSRNNNHRSNRSESSSFDYYQNLIMKSKRSSKNDDNNSKSIDSSCSKNSSSLLDVSIIARHAWFAAVYCGLWREALAVGAPPILIASALSTTNCNNNNNAKAACSAYLMSFEKFMIPSSSSSSKSKKNKTKKTKTNINGSISVSQKRYDYHSPIGITKSIGDSNTNSGKRIVSTTSSSMNSNNNNVKEFMSSASLGCYLALQAVKSENMTHQFNAMQNQLSSSSSSSAATWHDALKIVRVLSYRGHLVHPSFHIKLSNAVAYRSSNNNNRIIKNEMNNNNNYSNYRWTPAAMILKHVCCESKVAFEAWSYANQQQQLSTQQQQQEREEMSHSNSLSNIAKRGNDAKGGAATDASRKTPPQTANFYNSSTSTSTTAMGPPPTMRQALSAAHRLMREGKKRDALRAIDEQTGVAAPVTDLQNNKNNNVFDDQGVGGGVVVAVGNRAARDKFISVLNARSGANK